ncbi:sugar phosphate isomerase/epimerase [Blautia marasmi]|nr:sugar phosphate isomerase/epimerase [Blautia marasmi]
MIDISVSLYSFSVKFFERSYDLEDCVRKASELGFKGVEIVAAQMIENYPNPTDEWCEWFKGILKKYNMEPLSYSAYIDMGQHTGRDLTEEEIFQCTLNDIIYANRLGFHIVRTQHAISPAILEKMIPYAKKWNVWIGVELHAPHNCRVGVWKEYFELFDRVGSDYIGVVPDMGIFQEHPHELFKHTAVESGIDKVQLESMIEDFENGMSKASMEKKYSISEAEQIAVLDNMYSTFHPATLEDFERMVPHSKYMHGKFYYINENEEDNCIPYRSIVQKISDLGFHGHIAAEYEGHFSDGTIDCVEQLRRYSNMMHRLVKEITP